MCLLDVCGCTAVGDDTRATADIVLSAEEITTKADPEGDAIRDANIFIFSDSGFLEKSAYVTGDRYEAMFVEHRRYSIFVCANFGYPVQIRDRSELESLLFHLAHPGDFSTGVPLSGSVENISPSGEIRIPLRRLCSKISISIDRSRLDPDVKMIVSSLEIGNCPRYCRVFAPSAVEDPDGCFPVGFGRDYLECAGLNSAGTDGLSGEVSLYMLENLQGEFPGNPASDGEKVLPENHPASGVCSYVELGIEYESEYSFTSGGLLKYRFYLGDSCRDANVGRNCHYHIKVTPQGSGISEDSWRIDKSALVTETVFKMEPEGYIEAEIGEQIHIRCTCSPEWAPFYCGDEELEEDHARGIYDYVKDEDGRGVLLTITGYGTGMVYMSAGNPINQAGLLYIHVKDKEEQQ
ncbi:MAG: hypothetical protein ACI39U_02055 [Candidatus Cryptobacteroides sp.]